MKTLCDFFKLPHFTKEDYLFIFEYVIVMQPVATALDILQGEKGVAVGNLLPAIKVIKNHLLELKYREDNKLQITIPLVDALLDGLSNRFDSFLTNEFYQLAAVLHPQFKFSWLGSSKEDDKLKQQLTNRLEKLLQQLADEERSGGPDNVRTPDDPHKDFYAGLNQTTLSSTPQGCIELTQYLNSKHTSDLAILDKYPNIKKLFVKFNASLPSSASVERLFSLGGRVLSPLRSTLSDPIFEILVFLKANKAILSMCV